MRQPQTLRGLGSARCAERCTAGAGGDSGKPTCGNTGRAPRVDLTMTEWRWKDSTAGQSQLAGEAEGSRNAGTRGMAGAALTTTGRVGIIRRPGSG